MNDDSDDSSSDDDDIKEVKFKTETNDANTKTINITAPSIQPHPLIQELN